MAIFRALQAACAALLLVLVGVLPVAAGIAGAAPASASGSAAIGGDRLAVHGVVVPRVAPPLPATVASGWLVADLGTGDVLAARDPHGHFAPASTLKALTALTLIPRLDAHRLFTPTFADVSVDGSRVGIVEHVAYPVSQLFTAMLVVSGNDAANALATANGGMAATVSQMNEQAAHLQAFDTHAVNPSGLDGPGQVSSPYDLALIARAAMQLPDFRAYVKTKHSSLVGTPGKPIAISSHDKLLYNYDGAIGIKNGYTVAAQATFIGAATRGGHTLVVTLMHTAPRYWPEAAALLDWGFAATASGVRPIGHLVDPLGTPGASARVRAATAPTGLAVNPASTRHGTSPLVPTAVLLGCVGAAAIFLRRRFT